MAKTASRRFDLHGREGIAIYLNHGKHISMALDAIVETASNSVGLSTETTRNARPRRRPSPIDLDVTPPISFFPVHAI